MLFCSEARKVFNLVGGGSVVQWIPQCVLIAFVFVFPSVNRKAILNLLLNCSSSVKYHWLNSQWLLHTTLCAPN